MKNIVLEKEDNISVEDVDYIKGILVYQNDIFRGVIIWKNGYYNIAYINGHLSFPYIKIEELISSFLKFNVGWSFKQL